MARTIGNNLINSRAFVIERFGLSGWARVLAALPPEDRQTLGQIAEDGWYDEQLMFRHLRAIVQELGDGDLELLEELGRADAARDITGTQRFFFRFANPAYVLEKAADYWRRFHDTGQWEVQRQPNGAVGTLTAFDVEDETFCATLKGYIGRMFELVGAKGAQAEHPGCRARGDHACVFTVRWQ